MGSFGKYGYGFGDSSNGSSGGGGSWQQLNEFEVGQAGSPMIDGQQVYSPVPNDATNVRVYASGVVLPNFELSIGGRYVTYNVGSGYLTIVGGVNSQEYIIIDIAK